MAFDDASSDVDENERFPEDQDKRLFLRIGRVPADEDAGPNRIPKRAMVVAAVGKGFVEYLAVDSWMINGRRIGDYANAEDYNFPRDIPGFQCDHFWNQHYLAGAGQLDNAILKYAKDGCEPRPIQDSLESIVDDYDLEPLDSSDATDDLGEEEETIGRQAADRKRKESLKVREAQRNKGERPIKAPIKAPINLQHNIRSIDMYGGEEELGQDDAEDIDAVICFRNTVSNRDLGLPKNLQATLDWSETYQSFKRYIKREEFGEQDMEEEPCLGQRLRHKDFKWWANFEIWICPQRVRGNGDSRPKELIEWKPHDPASKQAPVDLTNFLDVSGVSKYGRQLYIEIRIVKDPQKVQKDRIWVANNAKYEEGREKTYGFRTRSRKRSAPVTSALDDSDDDGTKAQHIIKRMRTN